MALVNFRKIVTSGFDEDALFAFTDGEEIFNFGRLATSGDLADGIFAAANGVTVRNFGRVETGGLGASGILVIGDDARIENFGSVVTRGGFSAPDDAFSEGLLAFGDRFLIANYGSIRVEGEFASAMVGVGANGVAVNYGRLDGFASAAVILAFGDGSRAINAGSLAATNIDSTGVLAIGAGGAAVNHGRIAMTGAGSFGMDTAGANNGVINDGVAMAAHGDGHALENSGLIEARGFFTLGIGARDGVNLAIRNDGRVMTDGDLAIGVALGGTERAYPPVLDGTIVNRGEIATRGDGSPGVLMVGDGHHLTNSGRIETDGGAFDRGSSGLLRSAGVVVTGDDALVENARPGVIRSKDAGSAAVELNVLERSGAPVADMSARLENFGLITAAVAVLGGAGAETVINQGRIDGDVMLGGGADSFVFARGGSLAGDLSLGGGDDLVRIERGAGTARIADFAAGLPVGDVVDVSAFFSSFGQLTAHSHQRGSDVVVDLGHHDTLVLRQVQLTALHANDFLFA
jgi:hypothetical protein